MLARTAANLYWMSRYLERAENLARVLEVNQGLAWLKAARPGEDMAAPLRLTDSEAAFAARIHRKPRRLLAISQAGIKDDDAIAVLSCHDFLRCQ